MKNMTEIIAAGYALCERVANCPKSNETPPANNFDGLIDDARDIVNQMNILTDKSKID